MIKTIISQLNSREQASIVRMLIFLLFLLSSKSIRESLWSVLRSILHWKIILPILFLILYNIWIIILLQEVSLRNISLLKDSLFRIFWSSIILLYQTVANKKDNIIRNIISDLFKRTLIIEFLSSLYVFNFWIEVILLPIITFIMIIIAFVDKKEEYKIVNDIFSYIFWWIIILYLVYIIQNIFSNYNLLVNETNIHIFWLPLILTLFNIPYIYIFSLIINYESLFCRMTNCFKTDKTLSNLLHKEVFKVCKLNLKKLNKVAWSNLWLYNKTETKEDLENIIKQLKKM